MKKKHKNYVTKKCSINETMKMQLYKTFQL